MKMFKLRSVTWVMDVGLIITLLQKFKHDNIALLK